MPFVKVYVDEFVYPGGVDVTDSEGKYNFRFHLPFCPGGMDMTTDVWADMYYTNFSPNGAPTLPYYLRRQDWTYCYDPIFLGGSLGGMMAYSDALAIQAASSVTAYAIDLYVDVMFLTGRILIGNPGGSLVPIGDTTEYTIAPVDGDTVNQLQYDFDGDGKPDRSVLGNLFEEAQSDGSTLSVFRAEPDAAGKYNLQGVYFSSRTDQSGAPDVIRQADNAKELGHNGLLSSISEDDFKNTDILVFRESTGQLVMERRGLRDAEIDGRAQIGMGQGDDNVFYRIMLRGPKDSNINVGGTNRAGNWNEWATRNQLEEPFSKQDGDHLRPGEWIRLVVINRATGYMGTQRIQLSDASKNPGGFLNVPVEDIVMRPPNLKIWAERTYQVEHGLSANGEDRRFLIGAEGAGLVNDAMIEVYSEWYDHDGRPLPEGLGAGDGEDYGLSGRLAKVVSTNYIDADSDSAIFPIGPGRQTQLLKIRDNLTVPEHFYIHVSGTQKDENPQFDAAGNAALEPFDSRPRTLTPFQVPVYDENKDWKTYNAYRDLLREQAEAETPDPDAVTPQKPLPSYVWSYRPEYQFSQYDLEIAEINRVNLNEQGEEEKENILDLSTPVISSGDQLIEFLYSLTGSTGGLLDRLSPIDGPQDLVLALGEEEVKLTLGQNQQIRIENIEHLASLSPEDFLTMRLYVNQDAGNILWEHAFHLTAIYPEALGVGEFIEISADEVAKGALPIYASVLTAKPSDEELYRVQWRVEGNGSLTRAIEANTDGAFGTGLFLSTKKDDKALVRAIIDDGGPGGIKTAAYYVTAGLASDIQIEANGKTVIGGLGAIQITATIKDAFGNLVEDGTLVQVDAPDMTVEGNLTTVDGQVNFDLIGRSVSGEKLLKIIVDNAEKTHSVNVEDIDINIAVASEIQTGTRNATVNVTFSSDYGDLSGLEVSLANHRGQLYQKDFVLDASQQASTSLNVGDFRGEGKIFAYVGEKIVERPFNVVEPADSPYILDTVIVADQAGAGSFSAGGLEVQYTNQTTIMVPGTAGETVDLSLWDYLSPALIPTLQFSMTREPINGVVLDSKRGHQGQASNINYISVSTPTGVGAYDFSQSGELSVGEEQGLVKQGNAGFVVRFQARDIGGVLVDYKAAGLLLELNSGKLQLSLATDQGLVTLESDNINLDEWYEVGAHVVGGELILQVNDVIQRAAVAGQIITGTGYYAVKIGNQYDGVIAGVSLYDWSEEKLVSFANDEQEVQAPVQNDGFARVAIQSRPAAFVAARMEREQRLLARQQQQNPLGFILSPAYAAMPADCRQFTPDDSSIFSYGEAYFKFLAECRIQEQIEKAAIKVTTADGKYSRGLALMELATLQLVYHHTFVQGTVIGALPDCARGVVLGDATSGAAMVCDLATSLLLIGDIRDFVLHGTYYFIDGEEDQRFNKPVFVFATLGILTTLAEFTGAGVVLDAAIAGCKSAAKVLTGSKVMMHLADDIDEVVLSKPFTEMPGAAVRYLNVMQVISLAAFYGGDVATFVTKSIDDPEDLRVWIDYLELYVARYSDEVAYNESAPQWLGLFMEPAYAAIADDIAEKLLTKGMPQFMQMLRDVIEQGTKLRSDQTKIGKAFTGALAELKHLESTGSSPVAADIVAIMHKTPTVKAMLLLNHVGGETAVKALRVFPCVPNNCPMQSMEKFMEDLANIADLVDEGKITEDALKGMDKVFASLGHVKVGDIEGPANLNMARGAVGVIASLKRITNTRTIDGFEVPEIINDAGGKELAKRIMDIRTTDGMLFEIKGWRYKDRSLEYLLGKADDEGGRIAGKISAQLFNDIVAKALNPNDKRVWVFADDAMEALKPEFVEEIVEKILSDNQLMQRFSRKLGKNDVAQLEKEFAEQNKLSNIVGDLFRGID